MGGFSSITGQETIVNADNASFDGTERAGVIATDGQMWIGSTALNAGGTHINVGALTSPDSSLTIGYSSPNITLEVTGGSTVGQTITGDTGGALSPTAGNWNILSSSTAGGSTGFSGSGSTLSLNLTDIPGANTTLGLNAGNSMTVGNTNTSLGQSSLQNLTEGAANVAIGTQSMFSSVDALRNVAIGVNTLFDGVSITDNVAVGHVAGAALTGIQNVLIGAFSGDSITSGSYNIAFGYDSASAYTSSESSNILVGNSGTLAESNTIRIGSQGAGAGQQNRNFQAGIASVITSNSEMVTIDTTTGQLGSTTIPAGTVTSVSGTADRITSTGGATPVIDIAATYVGQSSINTLGTITTGTWNGTDIALADGGTNASLTASNGGIFYSTATAGAILAGTATAGQILRSGASSAPSWSTSTYPATNAANTLLYASSANVMAALPTANSGILSTNSSGVPSISAASGNWLNTTRTAFLGNLNSTALNKTGNGATYTLGTDALTEIFDQGSDFTTAGVFTAPVTGRYLLSASIVLTGCSTNQNTVVTIVTSNRSYLVANGHGATNQDNGCSISHICDMDASDTATVTVLAVGEAGNTDDVAAGAKFSGFLVC